MGNAKQSAAAAVQITSDTSTLLRALSKTFTTSLTFVSELVQNARRAGASLIRVSITEDAFTVSDDGVGIADFGTLLAVAKSGWDEEVQKSDAPFGIGFLSAIYSAKTVAVISGGQRLAADTEHLLALKPVALEPVPMAKGTTVILGGHGRRVDELVHKVTELAKAYPVPIELNGELLPRPYALDADLDWVETSVGRINREVLLVGGSVQFYLQGAPIDLRQGYTTWRGAQGHLHLDSTQFEGRLPDRACLINSEQSHKRINEALRLAAIEEICSRAAGLTPEDFIGTYGERLQELRAFDVLNRYDCVPVRFVSVGDTRNGSLALNVDTVSCWESPEGAVVTREQLQARGVYFPDDDGEDVRADAWVLFKGGYKVDRRNLGGEHWLNDLVQEVSCEDISGVRLVEPQGEVSIDGSWVEADLRVAQRLFLVHDTLGKVEVPASEGVYLASEGAIFARPDTDPSVVLQANSFLDGNEHYDETAEGDAKEAFEIALSRVINKDPTRTLHAFLKKGLPWRATDDLRGRTFTVSFDDNGEFTVAAV